MTQTDQGRQSNNPDSFNKQRTGNTALSWMMEHPYKTALFAAGVTTALTYVWQHYFGVGASDIYGLPPAPLGYLQPSAIASSPVPCMLATPSTFPDALVYPNALQPGASGAPSPSTVLRRAPVVSLMDDTGFSGTDRITNNGRLKVSGIEPGSISQYSVDNGKTWSSQHTPVNGANDVLVRQIDIAGNTGPSSRIVYTVDTTAAAAPVVSLMDDTGVSGTDRITNNGRLKVSGIEPGSISQYSVNNGKTWSTQHTPVNGANDVLVRQIDIAGNTGPSSRFAFTLAQTEVAPSAPQATGSLRAPPPTAPHPNNTRAVLS